MKMLVFAGRNRKEILRDPLSTVFGLGFPTVLLLIFYFMQKNVPDMPQEVFGIRAFAPGMAVFGLSFLTLFLGMLMTGDRKSAFLTRLLASPMTAGDFLAGYALPVLGLAIAQNIVFFFLAILLGLPPDIHLLAALIALLPAALLFVGLGLLLGSLLSSETQVGGIGSILINVCAFLSGTWFSLDMLGDAFARICRLLPFAHAVDAVKCALAGEYSTVPAHVLWVLGYAAAAWGVAAWLFHRRRRE